MSINANNMVPKTTIRLEPLPGAPSNPPSKKRREKEALQQTALKHLKRFARKHKTPKPYVRTVECRISRMPDGKLQRLCDRKRASAEWMRMVDEARRVHAARPAAPPERRGADEGLSELFGSMTMGEDEGGDAVSTTRLEGDVSSDGSGEHGRAAASEGRTEKEQTMSDCLDMLDHMNIDQHEATAEEGDSPVEQDEEGDEGYATAAPSEGN